jgi:hypothetical protein
MSVGIGHVIEEQVFQSFPKGGTALIAASARSGPAIAPEGESLTMFTGALINTVSNGLAGERRELSFRDIVDAVRARISDIYGSSGVAPEIHAPQQEEGDITFTPFFVNRAFVAPHEKETESEREDFEFAVADLDRLSPKTRAAVETLNELLLRAHPAAGAFRKEILDKLTVVKENDDSRRIITRCEEILAGWRGHSHVFASVPPSRVVSYANGDRYEGEVRDDKPNGRGVYTWPDGRRYDGEWRNGKRNGHGVYTWHDGRRYDGEWRNDKKNGHGVYTWPGGDRYDGEFLDDEYNGHGVYTWPGGRRYAGEWRNGRAVSRARRLFGLSGGLGRSEGANEIDEPTKRKTPTRPKTFDLFPHSSTEAFLRISMLSISLMVISLILIMHGNNSYASFNPAKATTFFGFLFSLGPIYYFYKVQTLSISHIILFCLSNISAGGSGVLFIILVFLNN